MKNRVKGKGFYFVTFAFSAMVRMLQIAGEFQIRLALDDIGMLASTAYLAGYDWSSVVGCTNYYGVVYYMLFAPVLKYISNPLTVWLVIIIANMVLQSLACVLSYHIAIRYFKFQPNLLTSLIAVICSFVVATYPCMSQEPVLYFLTWLLVLVMLKMRAVSRSKVRSYLYSVILALICAYAYLVHSRAIVFVVALFLTFLVLVYYDRSKGKYFLCFVVTVILAMLLASVMQKGIIAVLWKQKETQLKNVNVEVSADTIKTMLTPTGIRVLFDMFVSNLFTEAGRTFGINILAIVMGCMLVLGTKIKKFAISITLDKTIILVFSLVCYLIGVLGVCVTWGKGVVPVYFTEEVNNYYKGFIYFRYSATFLGPAVLVALGECLYNADLRVKMKLPVIISELFIVWYFFLFIIEKIENNRYANSAVVKYFNTEVSGFDIVNYKVTVMMVFIFTSLFFVEWRKVNIKGVILLFCILCSLIPYVRNGSGLIPKPQLKKTVDGGYSLIKYLEGMNVLPDTIYCPDKTYAYGYQFQLKEYHIIVKYPTGERNEIMFSSRGKKTDNIPEGFEVVQLDSNEWVWTNDKDLYEIIMIYASQKE